MRRREYASLVRLSEAFLKRVIGWFLGAVVLLLAVAMAGLLYVMAGERGLRRFLRPTPDEAWEEFISPGKWAFDGAVAEDQLVCPLLRSGRQAVPRIVREIENPGLELRLYAIEALGHLGGEMAVPYLVGLVQDEKEEARDEALRALYRADEEEGRRLATALSNRRDELGKLAMSLVDGRDLPERKGYLQGVFCLHD